MRGLGIGILIATIVLSIGNKKEKLSDEEVMAKARELGMVMQEDTDKNLEAVLENISAKKDKDAQDTNETDNNTDVDDDTVADDEVDADDDTKVDAAEVDADVDTSEEINDTNIDTDTDTDVDTYEEINDTDTDADIDTPSTDQTYITFTISRGMSSGQVSELIMQKGLIENAVDFDNYIKQKGKSGVIKIGIYTLPIDSDYQKILEAIAG